MPRGSRSKTAAAAAALADQVNQDQLQLRQRQVEAAAEKEAANPRSAEELQRDIDNNQGFLALDNDTVGESIIGMLSEEERKSVAALAEAVSMLNTDSGDREAIKQKVKEALDLQKQSIEHRYRRAQDSDVGSRGLAALQQHAANAASAAAAKNLDETEASLVANRQKEAMAKRWSDKAAADMKDKERQIAALSAELEASKKSKEEVDKQQRLAQLEVQKAHQQQLENALLKKERVTRLTQAALDASTAKQNKAAEMIEAIENGTESVSDQTYTEMMDSLSRSADRKRKKELEEAVKEAVQEEEADEADEADELDPEELVSKRKHESSMTAWFEQIVEFTKHGIPGKRKGRLNRAIDEYVADPTNAMHALVRETFKDVFEEEEKRLAKAASSEPSAGKKRKGKEPADADSSKKKAKTDDPEKMNKKDLLAHALALEDEILELRVIHDVMREAVALGKITSDGQEYILSATKARAAAVLALANQEEDVLGTPPAKKARKSGSGSNNDEASGSADPHVMAD